MPTPATVFILIAILADGHQSVAPADFVSMEQCTAEGRRLVAEFSKGLDATMPFVCATSSKMNDVQKLFSRRSLGTN